MKILYGVQGTGNGHITRARVMAKAFKHKPHIAVDYLFSGRPEDGYFDMACFSNPRYYRGLTFAIINGQMHYLKTITKNNIFQFMKDCRRLDLSAYDCVITDFEPITAWAAKKSQLPVLGIGHQYVFDYVDHEQKANWLNRFIINHFAPSEQIMPLHWHHYDAPIAPPIVEQLDVSKIRLKQHVLVYLPFENQSMIVQTLDAINSHQFILYTPADVSSRSAHVRIKPLSRSGFLKDLHESDAVIANAGFELSSEALFLGKKLLVRPLQGQGEQLANAVALKSLNYAHVMHQINITQIKQFLDSDLRVRIDFPDVASYIVDWIDAGFPKRDAAWYQVLWDKVVINRF